MRSFFLGAIALVVGTAVAVANEPISITLTAEDGFELAASRWQGEPGAGGVLLLHQCNSTRAMYDDLGTDLSDRGFHVLSLDFRGFGDSTTEEVSASYIRQTATSRENYFERFNLIQAHWPSDVNLALSHFREISNVATSDIVLVGASCGGNSVLGLVANLEPFAGAVLFSALITPDGEATIEAHPELPILMIGAEEDASADVMTTYPRVFANAPNPETTLVFYKGGLHGEALFEPHPTLRPLMVDWIAAHLAD